MLKRLFTLTCILGVLFALSPAEVHAEDHMHYTCGENACHNLSHLSTSLKKDRQSYFAWTDPSSLPAGSKNNTPKYYYLDTDVTLNRLIFLPERYLFA